MNDFDPRPVRTLLKYLYKNHRKELIAYLFLLPVITLGVLACISVMIIFL